MTTKCVEYATKMADADQMKAFEGSGVFVGFCRKCNYHTNRFGFDSHAEGEVQEHLWQEHGVVSFRMAV